MIVYRGAKTDRIFFHLAVAVDTSRFKADVGMAATTAWCLFGGELCGFSEVGSSVGFVGFLWLVRLCWLVLLVLLVGWLVG